MCNNNGFSVGDEVVLTSNYNGLRVGNEGKVVSRAYNVEYKNCIYHVPEENLKVKEKKLRMYRLTFFPYEQYIVRAYTKKNARKVIVDYLKVNYPRDNEYSYILSQQHTSCEYLGKSFNDPALLKEEVLMADFSDYSLID